MKLLVIGALLALSGVAVADPMKCRDPEYAQLKGAGKSELRDEYCHMTRYAELNDKFRSSIEQAIDEKMKGGFDNTRERAELVDVVRAAGSCRVAAARFEDALSRRFKSKPPRSCN